MEKLKRYFTKDKFAQYIGIEIVDVSAGRAKVRLEVKEQHFNGVRSVHGGVLFTLADMAFAVAANSRGRVAVAISASISFVKASHGGVLFAEAEEVSVSERLATYAIRVMNEANDVLAVFQGTAYRKKDNVDFFERA